MRLLGISGSLRSGSHNTALLRAAGELLAPPARLELLAGVGDIPAYNEDDDTARRRRGSSRCAARSRRPTPC